MIRTILLVLVLLLPIPAIAQSDSSKADFPSHVQQQFHEVDQLWQVREIEKAVAILEELVTHEELRTLGWAWRNTLYNLACGYALLGRKDQALRHLREATEAGFANIKHLEEDSDLDSIRTMPGFLDLLRKLKAFEGLWESAPLNTPYREDLSWEEKIAGLSKLWAEVKYNFAFFDRLPEVGWDSLYIEYLTEVPQTTSTLEYYQMLQEMTAHLHDGHTGVNLPPELYDQIFFRPAIRTRLIENRVLVVSVDSSSTASTSAFPHPGDEILRIDGDPVRDYAAGRVLPYVRASTPQARDVWTYDYNLLLGRKGTVCELELRGNDEATHEVRVTRDIPVMVRPDTEPHVQWLSGGIAHLTLKSFADNSVISDFDSLFAALAHSKALIIDLRDNGGGNSGVGYALLGHLTDTPFPIVRCGSRNYRPLRRAQGFRWEWDEEDPESWPANGAWRYEKPVAVLISPRTGSAAEDFCAAFQSMRRGKLVGEVTAGSTGQPLVFRLPGGGTATVCTARCTFPDGEEFVGIGIRPDIAVHPSVDDTKEGRDTVLEEALQSLRLPGVGVGEGVK